MNIAPKLAGLPPRTGHHGPESDAAVVRPASTQWMSDELVSETRRVWSRAYERVIDDEEAIEILSNVRRLAGVLLRAEQEETP